MPAKKEPLRQCIGCMEMKSKKQLVRIVKNKDGEIFIDRIGKADGRETAGIKNRILFFFL